MPVESSSVIDVDQTILRPIVYEVLKEVFKITRQSQNTVIQFPSTPDAVQNFGSSIDDQDRTARFGVGKYTFVEVSETHSLERMNETYEFDNEFDPIFYDGKIGVGIYPMYSFKDVQINIRRRTPSKTEAEQWIAEMYHKSANGGEYYLHDFSYSFIVPSTLMEVLKMVHKLRETVDPYGEEFGTYLKKHLAKAVGISGDRAGNNPVYKVYDKQLRVQGFFDFVGFPDKPVRDGNTGTWEVTYQYRFTYQKPDQCFIRYPVIVHNQSIPMKYVHYLEKEIDYESRPKKYSRSYEALSMFEAGEELLLSKPIQPFVRLPYFDDFKLGAVPVGSATMLIGLCAVDFDRRFLLDLTDLGTAHIDPDILEFMKSDYPYMTKLYKSVFHIALYINNRFCDDSYLEITPDLKIKAKIDLNLREQHRIRIALMPDVRRLYRPALKRLMKYPKAFVKTLSGINEALRIDPDFNKLYDRPEIQPYEFERIYELLTDQALHNGLSVDSDDPGNTPPYGVDIDSDPYSQNKQLFLPGLTRQQLNEIYKRRYLNYHTQISMIVVQPNKK